MARHGEGWHIGQMTLEWTVDLENRAMTAVALYSPGLSLLPNGRVVRIDKCESGIGFCEMLPKLPRPAWEDDSKLETKNIAFPHTSFWRLRIPGFHSVLPCGS